MRKFLFKRFKRKTKRVPISEINSDVRHFLIAGKQTKVTRRIRAYANKFPNQDIATVKKIMLDLVSFKRIEYSELEIKKVYSKRTASEILRDRTIATTANPKHGLHGRVAGCIDYNILLCATLRAKRIPAAFVRKKEHSTTIFFLNGKWYLADPLITYRNSLTKNIDSRIETSKPDISELNFQSLKESPSLAIGLDAHGVGIFDITDYKKY